MRTKLSGILTLVLAFTVQMVFAQAQTVTGTVSDEEGLPLPGVNITITGTDQGTQTDFNGKYSIDADQGQTLIFKYIGFADQKIKVGNQTTVNVTMEESSAELDEVVVTGYGTTTKRKSAAATTTITAENIENRPNASLVNSLQGQVAGLNIGTNSGSPGADSQVILRGVGSINGNIEPLFIIDGTPVDGDNFRSINPNDIASVSVLKDAAATAVYGNRGSNGVIVINTKGGSFGQQLSIRYNAQYGFSELPNLNIDLMNSRQKLTFERDNAIAGARGLGLSDGEINAIANQTNTYWPDIFFRKAPTNSHNLSISSGSETISSYTSLGYFEQKGTFIASDLQRFSFRNKINTKSDDDKFHFTSNINVNFTENNYPANRDNAGGNQTYFNPFLNAVGGLPYLSPFDPDGGLTNDGGLTPSTFLAEDSPLVLLNSVYYNLKKEEEIKAVGNISADWNFAGDFTVGGRFGIDFTSIRYSRRLHPESLLGPYQTDFDAQFGGLESQTSSYDARLNSNAYLNYNNTWDDVHTIDASIYTEYSKSYLKGISFTEFGLNSKRIGSGAAYIDGNTIPDYDDDARPYIDNVGRTDISVGLFSYFATADYDYDGRFGFSGSIRRDATSRFIGDNQWGTFYSVAGRWNIDQESWMRDSNFNLLKLRASYGTTGNQRILSGYYAGLQQYQTTFASPGGYNNSSAFALGGLGNPNLKWETTKTYNVGVDFAINNNKFQGSVDVFSSKVTDLLQTRRVSPITTQTQLSSNIGSLQNQGVEVNFTYNLIDTEDWRLRLRANGSYIKNEILELSGDNDEGIIPSGGPTSLAEGEPIGSYYLVDYVGVNPANGNGLYRNADGNLTENYSSADDRQYSDRQRYPVWQGGFGGTLSYKNFSLSNQWVFQAEVYRIAGDLIDAEGSGTLNGANKSTSLFRAWKQPGDITDIPRINGTYGINNYVNENDRYVQNSSFLRLRTIQLAYSLDDEILEKLPFTNLKLYVQAENLITFTEFQGFDPESDYRALSFRRYPTPKIYTLGVNVNF
jgi:TonB-linked SusC/RagA family outer membrane protein